MNGKPAPRHRRRRLAVLPLGKGPAGRPYHRPGADQTLTVTGGQPCRRRGIEGGETRNNFGHADTLECHACHSTWGNMCYGCHLTLADYDRDRNFPLNYYSNISGKLTPGQIVEDLTLCCDADWFQIMVDSGKEIAVDLEYLTEASSKPVVVLTAPGAPAVTLPCTWDGCAGVATAGAAGAAYLKITGPANTWYDVTVTLSGGGGADDSCVGYCGESAPSGCWCDSSCLEYNDCCADICTVCPDACSA